MSDYTELSGAGIKVIRAAFAAALSEREGLDIASRSIDEVKLTFQNQFLTFMDYSPMGYPMGDELIPLAELYSNGSGAEPSSDNDDNEPEITTLDIQLDDTKAHLHDKLLNISPRFSPTFSLTDEYPILNRVYEKVLRHSEFAGKVGSDSAELLEAKNFLFPDNDSGIPVASDAYTLYEEYANKYLDMKLEISQARSSGDNTVVELLQQKLERIHAEWIAIGQKNQVEAALKVLNTSDADAGYEDERNKYLDLLQSRLRTRLSSTEDYAAVTLSPLKPLLEPEEEGFWQKLVLTKEDIEEYITPEICFLFKVDNEELDYVLKNFRSASIEYVRVLVTREWLSKDFLQARYWRNLNSTFSNGKGDGEAPTAISSVYFIKNALLKMHAGVDIKEVGQVQSSDEKKGTIIAYEAARTPLIHALVKKEAQENTSKSTSKLLNIKTINRIKTVSKLQITETKKLKSAKRIKASQGLLHKKFKTPEKKRPTKLVRAKARLNPRLSVVSRLKGIKLRPGLVINKDKKTSNEKKLRVTGRIKHNNYTSKDDLLISYTLIDHNGAELETQGIKISSKAGELVFSTEIKNIVRQSGSKVQEAKSVIILISDVDGNQLLTKSLDFGSKDKTVSLALEAKAGSIDMELSSHVTPTLFAYSIEVLPKAPNPDPSLF